MATEFQPTARGPRRWGPHAAVAVTAAVLAAAATAAIVVPPRAVPDAARPLTTTGIADVLVLPSGQRPAMPDARITAAQLGRDASLYAAEISAVNAERQGLRAAILAIAVGLLTSLGLLVRWLGQRETERRNLQDRSKDEREAAHATDERRDQRFATAIEHLSHSDPSVKIGGIYTLEALAKEDPGGRSETVIQILTSFTEADRSSRSQAENPRRSPLVMRVAYAATARARIGATEVDLAFADLSEANLSHANLFGADLRGADLGRADLTGADLTRAVLYRANLGGALLRDAILNNANLSGASLEGADLTSANLTEANLGNAELDGAQLDGADLSDAYMDGADLGDLTFVGIDDERLGLEDLRGSALTGVYGWGSHPSHGTFAARAATDALGLASRASARHDLSIDRVARIRRCLRPTGVVTSRSARRGRAGWGASPTTQPTSRLSWSRAGATSGQSLPLAGRRPVQPKVVRRRVGRR